MNRRSLAFGTIAILAIIVVGAIAYYHFGAERRRVQTASQSPIVGKAQVGQAAPAFEVATTAGLFDLGKATKPVFLEVFATWCPHCQRETAVVDKVYRKYRNAVDFVAVSGSDTAMDGTSASSQRDVLDWMRRFNVEYPVGYDPLLNVANLYLQGGFPTFAVIARDKRVTYLESGEISYRDLDAALAKAVRR
jgi:cytochrome c biogenesis protein CcmG, thiol:disulfide interchange protein DsbE